MNMSFCSSRSILSFSAGPSCCGKWAARLSFLFLQSFGHAWQCFNIYFIAALHIPLQIIKWNKNIQRNDTGRLFKKRSFKIIIAFVVMQPWKWLWNILPAQKLLQDLSQNSEFWSGARHTKWRHYNTENHEDKVLQESGLSLLSTSGEIVFNLTKYCQDSSRHEDWLNHYPVLENNPSWKSHIFRSNFISPSGDSHVRNQHYITDLKADKGTNCSCRSLGWMDNPDRMV